MIVIVAGLIATFPLGGVLWDYGQYALGLERLGHEVYYLEDTGWQTYDPTTLNYGEDCSYGVRFLQNALVTLSPTLAQRWHFRAMDGATYGMDADAFARIVAKADLFLNVSGGCLLRDAYMTCPRKVFLDTDPGWNHFVVFPKRDSAGPGEGTRSFRDHDYFLPMHRVSIIWTALCRRWGCPGKQRSHL